MPISSHYFLNFSLVIVFIPIRVCSPLWQAVAAVDNHVKTGRVGACITRQVQVCALELSGVTLAAMRILAS